MLHLSQKATWSLQLLWTHLDGKQRSCSDWKTLAALDKNMSRNTTCLIAVAWHMPHQLAWHMFFLAFDFRHVCLWWLVSISLVERDIGPKQWSSSCRTNSVSCSATRSSVQLGATGIGTNNDQLARPEPEQAAQILVGFPKLVIQQSSNQESSKNNPTDPTCHRKVSSPRNPGSLGSLF